MKSADKILRSSITENNPLILRLGNRVEIQKGEETKGYLVIETDKTTYNSATLQSIEMVSEFIKIKLL